MIDVCTVKQSAPVDPNATATLGDLDRLFDRVEERLAAMEKRMEQRMDKMDQRMDTMEAKMDLLFRGIEQRVSVIEEMLDIDYTTKASPLFPKTT